MGESTVAASRPRAFPIGGAVLFVAVLTTLGLLRQSGEPSWRTLFAEDGAELVPGTDRWGALVETIGGHLHLGQRLLALPSQLLPARTLAAYFALAGALSAALLALAVVHLSRDLIPNIALRVTLGASVVVAPVAIGENLATVVYLMWPLLLACFWALVAEPVTRRDVVLASVVVFLAATSSALTFLLVPIAAIGWLLHRGRGRTIVGTAFVAGLVLQALVTVLRGTTRQTDISSVGDLAPLYGARVLGSWLVGERWLAQWWTSAGWVITITATVVAVVTCSVLAVRTRGWPLAVATMAVGGSALFYMFAVYERGTAPLRLSHGYVDGFSRYAYFALLLFLSGLFVLLANSRVANSTRIAAITVVIAQVVLVSLVGLRADNGRSAGPSWHTGLEVAREECAAGADVAVVPITPPGWTTTLPCHRVGTPP